MGVQSRGGRDSRNAVLDMRKGTLHLHETPKDQFSEQALRASWKWTPAASRHLPQPTSQQISSLMGHWNLHLITQRLPKSLWPFNSAMKPPTPRAVSAEVPAGGWDPQSHPVLQDLDGNRHDAEDCSGGSCSFPCGLLSLHRGPPLEAAGCLRVVLLHSSCSPQLHTASPQAPCKYSTWYLRKWHFNVITHLTRVPTQLLITPTSRYKTQHNRTVFSCRRPWSLTLRLAPKDKYPINMGFEFTTLGLTELNIKPALSWHFCGQEWKAETRGALKLENTAPSSLIGRGLHANHSHCVGPWIPPGCRAGLRHKPLLSRATPAATETPWDAGPTQHAYPALLCLLPCHLSTQVAQDQALQMSVSWCSLPYSYPFNCQDPFVRTCGCWVKAQHAETERYFCSAPPLPGATRSMNKTLSVTRKNKPSCYTKLHTLGRAEHLWPS